MANPVIVPCPEGAWTKVVDNKTNGVIHKRSLIINFLQTYRVAGDPVPTTIANGLGVRAFKNNDPEVVSNTAAIDVYLWALNGVGEVRVDL